MPRLDIALFNYRDGGRISSGGYDFAPLTAAFAGVETPPALILLNEANRWGEDGSRPLLAAAGALSQELGPPYQARLGSCDRGPIGPALIYNPMLVDLEFWGGTDSTVGVQARNTAEIRTRSGARLRVVLQHWDYASGTRRRTEAETIAWAGAPDMPTLLGGDLNSTASGPHLPSKDWQKLPVRTRHHKGWQPDGPGTPWTADTRAMDHLIGVWGSEAGRRIDGAGFHALCELAHAQGTPAEQAFRPTTNTPPERGGGMVIDWLLVNAPLRNALIPGSYRVHLPDPGSPPPSDHRLVSAALKI